MLSVAPSQAVAGVPTVTATDGSALVTLGANGETATAASVTITGLLGSAAESYSVKAFRKSAPDSALADGLFFIAYLDTATYTASKVDSATYATALTGEVVTNANAKKTNAY